MATYRAEKSGDSDQKFERKILEEGYYNAQILDCEERVSQAGNEMFRIKLGVIDDSGNSIWVWDWLVFTARAMWRVSQFRRAVGAKETDKAEMNPDDYVGKRVKIKLVHARDDENEIRMRVGEWIAPVVTGGKRDIAPKNTAREPVTTDEDGDEVPF